MATLKAITFLEGLASTTVPHIQRSTNNTIRPRAEQQQRRPHIQRSTNNTIRPRAEQQQRRPHIQRSANNTLQP
eukprot:scaffold198297_cov45-Attheya_sp.AAC.1